MSGITARPRGSRTTLASPVLVGAVTLLVTNVAVFLSYNANNGLPFVPTKQVRVELANGAALLPGNEVREGGYRIGVVDDMQATTLSNGEVGAIATLKLDADQADVPADSRVVIRPRSVLGLKYVELQRGRFERTLQDGDTLPVTQSRLPVELDELYGIFDERTRLGARRNLKGFGNAFANRGPSLNETIGDAPRFLSRLEPVARNLADPQTNLRDFFGELGDAARVVRPVADVYATGFTTQADVFEAWSRNEQELKTTISEAAPTMRIGIESFRAQRPFLAALEGFSVALEDAADELPRTLPRITPALREGQPVLRRSASLNEDLQETLKALGELSSAPGTSSGLKGLTALKDSLNPTVRYVGPYITVCNYFNYSWTNVAEHLTEPDPTGTSQRTLLNQSPRQDNSIGTIGAVEPANGRNVISGTPAYLHSNVYGAAIDSKGNADCESGQRGYVERQAYYADPKFKIVVDPSLPGLSGTTFTGRPKVPAGQTFSRRPQLGPKLPAPLDRPEVGGP